MKLLFDHSLSPRLVRSFSSLYPDSIHVRHVHLQPQMMNRYGIMQLCKALSLSQKKVIWIRLGNCRTNQIEALLRDHVHEVEAFTSDEEAAFLALG